MLPPERLSRLQGTISHHVHPNRISRAYTTQLSRTVRPSNSSPINSLAVTDRARSCQSSLLSVRSQIQVRRASGAVLGRDASALDNSIPPISSTLFENPKDVRDYLKRWSEDHQQQIRSNAPEHVQLQRNAALPNSLFLRGNIEGDDKADADSSANDDDLDLPSGYANEADETSRLAMRESFPGDVLSMRSTNGRVRDQLAVFLGTRGVQSLYLLNDGRWYADCEYLFKNGICRGLVTPAEIALIEPHLPRQTIEYRKAGDQGAAIPFAAMGDVPYTAAAPLLEKLSALNEDMEAAKRQYSSVLETIYEKGADESLWKFELFETFLRDCANIDFDTLSEGAKLYLNNSVFDDERMVPLLSSDLHKVGLMPKKLLSTLRTVTQWARSYQDAAARAATGQNVMDELQKNPLTGFISKARRLIAKSRKIRLPTSEGHLGPTLEIARPPSGAVERRPSGEEFTQDEKAIIEFIWSSFVRRPTSKSAGAKRSVAIASLIIRAVGAYPNFVLDVIVGKLFLQELGCLDPWLMTYDHNVTLPAGSLGLNYGAVIARQEAEVAATTALEMKSEPNIPPFPDTMASLRKELKGLEVFCIDSAATRVVDDGISLEPSQEHPDHYWVHIHVAHLSAFVPHDHSILAQGDVMGATFYHTYGPLSYIPYDVIQLYSLKKDSEALTISTLLSLDGTVKAIEVQPTILRNVIHINKDMFEERYSKARKPVFLSVGAAAGASPRVTQAAYALEQEQLLQRHKPTFDLLQKLLLARWNARTRENPECLNMLKLPNISLFPDISPLAAVQSDTRDRMYRSEHVAGDPAIKVKAAFGDHDGARYRDQAIKDNVVAGAMILAAESTAVWASSRQIPFLYRFTKLTHKASLQDMNNLGPHDYYVAPAGGESVDMHVHLALNTPGYVHVTSPLRRYRDLINHYQIDAFLKGEAAQRDGSKAMIQYPRSRNDLVKVSRHTADGNLLAIASKDQTGDWVFMALFRAFYFGEAKLPKIWDVTINNPVLVSGSPHDLATTTIGKIIALGVPVIFEKSQEGWENLAKFRQYVPSKLIKLEANGRLAVVRAVGPPSDRPYVEDCAYPELQPAPSENVHDGQ